MSSEVDSRPGVGTNASRLVCHGGWAYVLSRLEIDRDDMY